MHDFTILVIPGAFAASVASTLNILATAATVSERLGLAAPRWRVCGPQPGAVALGHGMQLHVQPIEQSTDDQSCWVIPESASVISTSSKVASRSHGPLPFSLY